MRLKKRNRFIEYLLGISFPMIGIALFSLFTQDLGLLGLSAIGTSIVMTFFFTLAPFLSSGISSFDGLDHLQNLLAIAAFAVSLYALIKFLHPPYLRFGIAVHYALWMVYGIKFAALIY